MRARPPRCDPVNPTAWVRGCFTRAMANSGRLPCKSEKTPAGSPQAAAARFTAPATHSLVPGWAGCPFTTTGQPAARALAVSPPATENASGKLLAPNTATGPNGRSMRLKSGRGSGVRSGSATSIRASHQEPSRSTSAKSRNCPTVRPRSPINRSRGRPDSALARWSRGSPSARISSAIRSRKVARSVAEVFRNTPNAVSAEWSAASTSSDRLSPNAGSSFSPVRGSNA